MEEYTIEELAAMAEEEWAEAFSKMPPVPYLEATLSAIAHAAQEPTRIAMVEDLCEMVAFAAREAASESHSIEYLDNSLREALAHNAERHGWLFLKDHIENAQAKALRLEQERMPLGGEDADDEN